MPAGRRRHIRRRARRIRKASDGKYRTKDYIQIAVVILVILAILITAFVLTSG